VGKGGFECVRMNERKDGTLGLNLTSGVERRLGQVKDWWLGSGMDGVGRYIFLLGKLFVDDVVDETMVMGDKRMIGDG
jgi:hypothetical protein